MEEQNKKITEKQEPNAQFANNKDRNICYSMLPPNLQENIMPSYDQDENFRKLIKERVDRHKSNSGLLENILRKLKGK
ncbi:MAG TPA: hypothetical protein PKN57_05450 [Saprospiraceae bacterium]|nr:hypothetical protein [Saprospiraceae bacterium]MCC6687936.1 hypothetical protein [Saprospiraceae bacterium]HMV23862.1 hypothetical protein [Saprospiraceae bacterium]HMX82446.1 hypothetical protein [Saprospiraceae bacterium]HMX86358.1 hypothetical protein [Saprospiraceae bacterium]